MKKRKDYIEIFRDIQRTKPLIAEELFIAGYFLQMSEKDIETFFLNPETKNLRKKIIEIFDENLKN